VSKKGQFKVGEFAVYIQPDSVVPQTESFRFIWESYVDPINSDAPISDRRRRITVRKFRGEWSEGLLMPVYDFDELVDSTLTRQFVESDWREGTDVSDTLGITHYDPDEGVERTDGDQGAAPRGKRRWPRSINGWIKMIWRYVTFTRGQEKFLEDAGKLCIPIYDVDALKNYPNVFREGEPVIVTEKIHGSNARFIFTDGMLYAGSHKQWTSPSSNSIFRKVLKSQPWIEEWCRAHEDYVLWGEVTPTQKGYEYGSKDPQLFVFDVRHPDGHWLSYDKEDESVTLQQLWTRSVPMLFFKVPYSKEGIMKIVDGISYVHGATNMREGVVIKAFPERHVRGVGRAQLKIVSKVFLEKDNK
jgi:hypothetical protein